MSGALNIRQARTVVAHLAVFLLLLAFANSGHALAAEPPLPPLHRTVDLDRGEPSRSSSPTEARRPSSCSTSRRLGIRCASAIRARRESRLEINGRPATLESPANVSPARITVGGVQIDCPVTQGPLSESRHVRGLLGAGQGRQAAAVARGRSPWIEPGTFVYPIKQRWFASATQIGQRAVLRRWRKDAPTGRTIYYHSGN